MKKLLTFMLVAALAVASMITTVACSSEKYVAKAITGIEVEEYGFAVGNNASKKAEIIGAMNEVIAEANIDEVVSYYTALSNDATPTVSLNFANLADNTNGTLNVYTCSGFEPYEFTNADGAVIGVDVYLMELVCEKLNMKINVVDMDFDGICGKVASEDNAVGAAGITITDERKQSVTFSNAYYSSVQYIISLENQAYTSLDKLAGKKIGVQKGTTGAALVDEAIASGVLKDTGATLVEYDTGAVAYTALKAGKIDFVVIDELPALKLVGATK